MASHDEVMAALAKVAGPDGKTPLPDSGAVSGLTSREGKVFLAIVIDPDQAKAMEPMRAAAEAAIKALPGVSGAVVTLDRGSPRGRSRAAARLRAMRMATEMPSARPVRPNRFPASSTSSPWPRAKAGSASPPSLAISPSASESSG